MTRSIRPTMPVQTLRIATGRRESRQDEAAVEEPLEVRVNGDPFAVIMRTPGDDRALALGFLFAEQVIASLDEVLTIEHCPREHPDDPQNVLFVRVTDAAAARGVAGRRTTTSTSCGLCGRATIESLKVDRPALARSWTVPADLVAALPDRLREAQPLFDATGGLHAAGLFGRDGVLIEAAEDVGRHNAVDKVIGRMVLAERLPLADHLLVVSGRSSFEIVQKAFLAGIPFVAAVSAPSSLAIDLALEAGLTLAGFARDGAFNVYAHAERIGR